MWPNSAKASPVHSTSAMVSMAITAPPAGPDLQISTKRTIYERRDQCREPASADRHRDDGGTRSEEHTSELQSLMRISYAVFCLNKKITTSIMHPANTNNRQIQ